MLMKINIGNDIIVSKQNEKIVIFLTNGVHDDKIFQIEDAAVIIWNLIEKNKMTRQELHGELENIFEKYGSEERKQTEQFLDQLENYKIIN